MTPEEAERLEKASDSSRTLKEKNKIWFEAIEKLDFEQTLNLYQLYFEEFLQMIQKCRNKISRDKFPSNKHLQKMRIVSTELGKIGKQFRTKTMKIQKGNKAYK